MWYWSTHFEGQLVTRTKEYVSGSILCRLHDRYLGKYWFQKNKDTWLSKYKVNGWETILSAIKTEKYSGQNWCFWTAVLEKTLKSPLDCKEIQPVHPKRNQSWIFIGRTDAEAEHSNTWPPDAKSWLIWKYPAPGKDLEQEEKGMTEDEMVGWHHRLNGHGFGWTPGVCDGQGGLLCCGSWGRKESDTTEQLSWTELSGEEINPFRYVALSYTLKYQYGFPFFFSCSTSIDFT